MINIDKNQMKLLQILMKSEDYVPLSWIQDEMRISRRTVYYLVNKANETLGIYAIDPIQNRRGKGYFLSEKQKEQIHNLFEESLVEPSLHSEDRVQYLICWLLYPNQIIHVETIMNHFEISRNSVFSDLKRVKQEVQQYHLSLVYHPKTGYRFIGTLSNFHAIFLHYISQLLQKMNYKELDFLNISETETYYGRLIEIADKLGNEYKEDNYLLAISCLLSITHYANEKFDFSLLELKDLGKTEELQLIDEYFQDFNVHERLYLAIYLLGSKVSSTVTYKDDEKDIELYELAQILTERFEKVSRIRFSEKNELINSLYLHFKLSLYYYRISIQVANPFVKDVKENYKDLYEIVHNLCIDMEDLFPFTLSESEIVYITIHFGGHIQNESNTAYRKVRVLIVCPSGISTSVLLRKEVENSFPNILVTNSVAISDIPSSLENVDFIITTVDVETELPVVKVHTILSKEDKARIASMISLNENTLITNKNGLNELLHVINQYIPPEDQAQARKDILNYLSNGNPLFQINEVTQYTLCEVLLKENIVVANKEMTWQEGIQTASRPLLKNGIIRSSYVTSMIGLVNDYGPYFVLRNGVALAHGKANEGANMLGLSLLVNNSNICFDDDLPVHFLFVLSSPDQNKHLRLLRDIMELSENQELIQSLLSLHSRSLMLEKIKEFFQ